MCICGRFFLKEKTDKDIKVKCVGTLDVNKLMKSQIDYIHGFYNLSGHDYKIKNGLLIIQK